MLIGNNESNNESIERITMGKKFLRSGGYMTVQEPVITLPNGLFQMTHGKLECDIVGCKHCGSVIKVVLKGVNASLETNYRCVYCDGPICRYCAENLQGSKGKCFPIMAQAEFKQKHGVWPHEMGVLDFRESVAS